MSVGLLAIHFMVPMHRQKDGQSSRRNVLLSMPPCSRGPRQIEPHIGIMVKTPKIIKLLINILDIYKYHLHRLN
jgi:hypothetical protein